MTTSQFVLDHSTTDHPRFAITSADKDGVCVVSVHGDLDHAAVPRFVESVDFSLSAALFAVVVDLTETRFLSSAGMAALQSAQGRALAGGVRCAVAADGPATARPLRAVGLSTEIAIYPTVACAMRAMREATSENPPTPVLTEAGSAR